MTVWCVDAAGRLEQSLATRSHIETQLERVCKMCTQACFLEHHDVTVKHTLLIVLHLVAANAGVVDADPPARSDCMYCCRLYSFACSTLLWLLARLYVSAKPDMSN